MPLKEPETEREHIARRNLTAVMRAVRDGDVARLFAPEPYRLERAGTHPGNKEVGEPARPDCPLVGADLTRLVDGRLALTGPEGGETVVDAPTDRSGLTVPPTGVRVIGATIDGTLNLDRREMPWPLWLRYTVFPDGMSLRGAKFGELELQGARFRGSRKGSPWVALDASFIDVSGSVFLTNAAVALEELPDGDGLMVDFSAAKIAGQLGLVGARFVGPTDGIAFRAQGADIRGGVFARSAVAELGDTPFGGASFFGAVVFWTAKLGSFEAAGATFDGRGGRALRLDGAVVDGLVSLAEGAPEVRDRDGSDGPRQPEARHRYGGMVDISSAKIGGSVFLTSSSFAHGDVHRLPPHIKERHVRTAVRLEGADIGGALRHDGATFEGVLDLSHCVCREYGDGFAPASDDTPPELRLDGFRYGAFRSGENRSADDRVKRWLNPRFATAGAFEPQPYDRLARVLSEHGDEWGARKVLMEKQRLTRKLGGVPRLGRVWMRASGALVGFGYAPWKGLIWLGGLVGLGYAAFAVADAADVIQPTAPALYGPARAVAEPYRDPAIFKAPAPDAAAPGAAAGGTPPPIAPPPEHPPFAPLIFSLDLALPILDLGQEGNWAISPPRETAGRRCFWDPGTPLGWFYDDWYKRALPAERRDAATITPWPRQAGCALILYQWLHTLLGWAITTITIAGLAGLIRGSSKPEG